MRIWYATGALRSIRTSPLAFLYSSAPGGHIHSSDLRKGLVRVKVDLLRTFRSHLGNVLKATYRPTLQHSLLSRRNAPHGFIESGKNVPFSHWTWRLSGRALQGFHELEEVVA